MKKASVDFSLLFASSIHDMKNSLGMIVHTIDRLTQVSARNPEEEKLLSTLHYEALRVNNDLVRLLGVYRMQENCMPLCIDQHYVRESLEDQSVKIGHLLSSENISIHIDCDDFLSCYFDYDLIAGVINNVLVNAIRYTKDQIKLIAHIENTQLLISIEDNGSGYPSEMISNPEGHMKGVDFNSGSTSLGLYFAGKVANLHQHKNNSGYILLKNGGSFGGGVFSIYIP